MEPLTGVTSGLSFLGNLGAGLASGGATSSAASGNNSITFAQFKGANNVTTALFVAAGIIAILALTK